MVTLSLFKTYFYYCYYNYRDRDCDRYRYRCYSRAHASLRRAKTEVGVWPNTNTSHLSATVNRDSSEDTAKKVINSHL